MNSHKPVIIVEDDMDDQEMFQDVFDTIGLKNEIRFFSEGRVALDYLRTTYEHPFIIITDVNLPGMDGIELRKEILKDDYLRRKSIPYIFMSTSDGKNVIDKVYDLQVQGYFQKENSLSAMANQIRIIFEYWENCKHPNN